MLFGVNCCLYGSFYGGYKATLVSWASFVAQLVKNQPAMWETWIQFLGWEDPLEKGKAIHSSVLAWRIPWTVQSRKESDTTERLSLKDTQKGRQEGACLKGFSYLCLCVLAASHAY